MRLKSIFEEKKRYISQSTFILIFKYFNHNKMQFKRCFNSVFLFFKWKNLNSGRKINNQLLWLQIFHFNLIWFMIRGWNNRWITTYYLLYENFIVLSPFLSFVPWRTKRRKKEEESVQKVADCDWSLNPHPHPP